MLKTAKEVEAKVKSRKPGKWAVGDGAYLQIAKGGTASWTCRYQHNGESRTLGLGPYALVGLADARQKAHAARKMLLDNIDPIEAKKAAKARSKLAAARTVTFKAEAQAYIKAHRAGWKNPKHAEQWPSTLATYAYPVFGDIAVGDVDTPLIVKALEPIWTTKAETASRVRSRIENILDWSRVRGYRPGENPARWKGHLDKLLAKQAKVKAVKHHPALPYAELPAFLAELRQRVGQSARALEFLIMTASRTAEVIGATWSEIDMRNGVWTIPAPRMKAGKEHRVPLAAPVQDLLRSLTRLNDNTHLFPGRDSKPLSNMAMLELLRGMRPGYVPHGFRSSFRDWAAEKTRCPNHVVEQALAHVIGDKVEAAYRRSDLFEKRRALMADWAEYCDSAQGPQQ